MKKDNKKYGIQLVLKEIQNNGEFISIDLIDYFEITEPEKINEVSGFFHENLLLYLEKHNIGKK